MSESTTRERIVAAADRLFYERGFDHTSFSDIAQAVQLSRGNFYFHFKSKDEILDAVIEARRANSHRMLERWDLESPDPAQRIRGFINMLIANRADLQRYGCPAGTLCSELAKLDHPSRSRADELLTLVRTWLSRQFTLLGCPDADALALHLLARSRGVATLASTFRDDKFIRDEVAQMCEWLEVHTQSHPQAARAGAPHEGEKRGAAAKRKRTTRPRSASRG
jgi:TetR/AcrR family transcriptional regulator, transcriptional repressor for nem operon